MNEETIGMFPTGDYFIKIRIENEKLCIYFEDNLILEADKEKAYNINGAIERAIRKLNGGFSCIPKTLTQELIDKLTEQGQTKYAKKIIKMRKQMGKHGIEEC